mmetsp:Transcript_39042/g.59467  ORF Transcript_39042/g.59467 Transcript_39042/m.59467 type:complete len:200 (+) Transcript_39042:99-698(+)
MVLQGERSVPYDVHGEFAQEGLHWGLLLLPLNDNPVDGSKEGVALDLLEAALTSEPLDGILLEYSLQEVHALGRPLDVVVELQLVHLDVLEQYFLIVIVERRHPGDELVQDHANEVPVNRFSVACFLHHLRSQVGVGPTEGVCAFESAHDVLSREAEVREEDVAVSVEHDVVRFEVSKDDVPLMKSIDGADDLADVASS